MKKEKIIAILILLPFTPFIIVLYLGGLLFDLLDWAIKELKK